MAIKHTGMCDICTKKRASDVHHLVFSNANRKLSDCDGLTLEICRDCHDNIHRVGTAEYLSKMLGQALWEREYYKKKAEELMNLPMEQTVTNIFTQRYGRNYL